MGHIRLEALATLPAEVLGRRVGVAVPGMERRANKPNYHLYFKSEPQADGRTFTAYQAALGPEMGEDGARLCMRKPTGKDQLPMLEISHIAAGHDGRYVSLVGNTLTVPVSDTQPVSVNGAAYGLLTHEREQVRTLFQTLIPQLRFNADERYDTRQGLLFPDGGKRETDLVLADRLALHEMANLLEHRLTQLEDIR